MLGLHEIRFEGYYDCYDECEHGFSIYYEVTASHDEEDADPLGPGYLFMEDEHGGDHAEDVREAA